MTAAQELFDAFEAQATVAPLSERDPALTIADAYAIQRELLALHAAAGRSVAARKVGLTSLAMQKIAGIDRPDFGAVLDAWVYDSGVSLARARDGMIAPRLEAELAFVLDRPLRGPDVALEDVLAATGSVLPMFEIVDSRIDDWKVGIVDTIADNASGWGVILGPPIDVDSRTLDTIDVVFERVGDETLTGTGDAVLGHPANAVAWLANTLAEFGEELPAGQPILSGSFTRVLEATPGHYRARFGGGVGEVELTIEEDAA